MRKIRQDANPIQIDFQIDSTDHDPNIIPIYPNEKLFGISSHGKPLSCLPSYIGPPSLEIQDGGDILFLNTPGTIARCDMHNNGGHTMVHTQNFRFRKFFVRT